MTAHRTAAAAALAGVAPLALSLLVAGPAAAHGAPTNPVSRVAACSPVGGGNAQTAACRAAVAANGRAFSDWDNLRVAGVNGRDRQLIPDGKLCSGGLPAFRGLDLARADWPATRVRPGAFTMTYSSTIPHEGTFKLYLSRSGYNPNRPLKWSDLEAQPFATSTNPSLVNGAYHINATLPGGRTGRHMLFTIWQNTSTPDTYYSCSDVVFPSAAGGSNGNGGGTGGSNSAASPGKSKSHAKHESKKKKAKPSASGPATDTPTPTASATRAEDPPQAASDRPVPAGSSEPSDGLSLPLVAGGSAVLVIAAGVAAATLRRRR